MTLTFGSIRYPGQDGNYYIVDPVAYAWESLHRTELPRRLRCDTPMALMSSRVSVSKSKSGTTGAKRMEVQYG